MQIPPDTLPARPGVAAAALGVVRVAAVAVLLIVGTVVLLGAALVPLRVGGVRPAEGVAVALCRAFLAATGVRLRVVNGDALRQHRGFVFFNHLSWLDPLVLVAVRPLRFLSTQGVRSIPFVGWMATALGTIYVHRGRDESREAARATLRAAVNRSATPVALAPEGEIGPGPGVLPFRHGAFEVAASADAEVVLVALQFAPHGRAMWGDGEWLIVPLWRMCARTEPFTATVTVLSPALPPLPPAAAAAEAERRLNAVLLPGARPVAAV